MNRYCSAPYEGWTNPNCTYERLQSNECNFGFWWRQRHPIFEFKGSVAKIIAIENREGSNYCIPDPIYRFGDKLFYFYDNNVYRFECVKSYSIVMTVLYFITNLLNFYPIFQMILKHTNIWAWLVVIVDIVVVVVVGYWCCFHHQRHWRCCRRWHCCRRHWHCRCCCRCCYLRCYCSLRDAVQIQCGSFQLIPSEEHRCFGTKREKRFLMTVAMGAKRAYISGELVHRRFTEIVEVFSI